MIWALRHPNEGIIEADEVDFREVLDLQMPYLGPVVGVYSDWTPLVDRGVLFSEDTDVEDPWQFRNFRVT
jgi:homospermidine synthase